MRRPVFGEQNVKRTKALSGRVETKKTVQKTKKRVFKKRPKRSSSKAVNRFNDICNYMNKLHTNTVENIVDFTLIRSTKFNEENESDTEDEG